MYYCITLYFHELFIFAQIRESAKNRESLVLANFLHFSVVQNFLYSRKLSARELLEFFTHEILVS